ncbi:MAG TPA: site-specific DNA-methyltransferase [Acidimicrobiales bacterium]|nr:site-specific DNA-methyltransferase [Acidimicrobiales bacterium]
MAYTSGREGVDAGAPVIDGSSVPPARRVRRPTATSRFGVSRRENHDASEFYERFPKLSVSDDEIINPASSVDEIWVGDAREMDRYGDVADASVALVVTSPPYFAGKEYETAIGEGHVPGSYVAYLEMLHGVFAECVRKLEPGGRIAVNVANLGRKPYRSLSADVIEILQRLGLLLRGEIVWVKAKAAGGSCAWGTFQRPGNPVLRDLTERVVVASKGRFDRARSARDRAAAEEPSVATISADEFMDLVNDVWEMPAESATRVGHPAPFPVELPRRLVDLYTYEGDLVLDPFMGSGSTAVAAVRSGRHFVGFDTDADYVAQALGRVDAERERVDAIGRPVRLPAVAGTDAGDAGPDAVAEVLRAGRKAKDVAQVALAAAGFERIQINVKVVPGVDASFRARDQDGQVWYVEVAGGFSSANPGLRRTETLWRVLGKASVLAAADAGARLLVLTTDVPPAGSPGARALAAVVGDGPGKTIADVVRLVVDDDLKRLRRHAEGAG